MNTKHKSFKEFLIEASIKHNYTFTTSNKQKQKEIKRIFPNANIENGRDLPEVQSNIDDVIIHKSLDAGAGYVVEDTILKIDGKEVVDIKWKLDELVEGQDVEWIVSLGYNDGNYIYIYRDILHGTIVAPRTDGYAFDPYVLPDGSDKTLAELEKEGKKDDFSPRKGALINLKNGNFIKKIKISDIPKWSGNYQNS